jgi:hypothetical protein
VISVFRGGAVFFVCLVIFRILLDVSYVFVISESFAYMGFQKNIYLFNYILSWFFYISTFFVLTNQLSKVSDFFFLIVVLLSIAPLTSLYGLDFNRAVSPVIAASLSLLIMNWIVRLRMVSFKKAKFIKHGEKIGITISILFVGFLIFWYYYSGVDLNFDFTKVYEFRRDNAEISAYGFFSYTNNWTYKIFSIFLMTLALHYRRFFLLALLLIAQTYFYAASAHKNVFLFPFLIIGIWYYFKRTSSLNVVPVILCSIIFISLSTFFLFDDLTVSSLFSRRVFFVPANLTYVYFEFFSINPSVLWSNSILSSYFDYPYDLPVSQRIGQYLGNELMSANNGYLSMGFAHLGWLGVFIYTLLIGGIIKLINDLTYKAMPIWIAIGLTLVPLRTLITGSDLFTVLLTHGLILTIVLIFITRKKIWISK